MNRQEYIDKYIGDIDVGDKVVFVERPPKHYKAPITAIVKDIFRGYSINFTLDCVDADGRKFEYYNASLNYLKKVSK